MMTKVKVAAGVLAAVLLVGWFIYTNSLKHERNRLLVESSTYQQAAASLARELEAKDREIETQGKALDHSEAENRRLAEETSTLRESKKGLH